MLCHTAKAHAAISTLMGIVFASSLAAIAAHAQGTALPFSFTVKERTENLPDYVSPPAMNLYNQTPNFKVGWGIDYPIGFASIDGDIWVMFNLGNQYGTHVKVARYKGADFEHAIRQSDGAIDVAEKNISTHFCGGMWYDSSSHTLYAPIHCEYDRTISPPAGWTRKKTRLATSSDHGETWHLEGDILTNDLPEDGDWLKFSGSMFEAGPADFDFYADTQGGYFYIFTCNAYAPKNGSMNNFLWYNEAARCAIADKMAPGAWHKFRNGTWTEPGLGGKSSRVVMGSDGIYGRVIYSSTLKKYLRVGRRLGAIDTRFTQLGYRDASVYISSCDDLSTQEWEPMAKLFDKPDNDKFGFTLADRKATDPFVCGRAFHVYNYWLYNLPSRSIDVTLDQGTTADAGFPRYSSYAYEPLPESGDTIVGRATKIVGSAASENTYAGGTWSVVHDPLYYQMQAMQCGTPGSSVEFSFRAGAIYWRAAADTDCGRADVFIDGKFAETVDCYFQQRLPFQFAFIRTGLDPHQMHTIRIVLRSDHNPRSNGTVIRHLAFEFTAESYRASAGFCSVAGKNNWSYRAWDGSEYSDLRFFDFVKTSMKDAKTGAVKEQRSFANDWGGDSGCVVGNNYQIPDKENTSVRTWTAPHRGTIRIEGTVHPGNDSGGAVTAAIMKNGNEVWPSRPVNGGITVSHDLTIQVEKGDAVSFLVGKTQEKWGGKTLWDPVITFEE